MRLLTTLDVRSEHDWSKIVGEDQLKLLMRHKNIETTRKYYAEIDADDVSSKIWDMANAAELISMEQKHHKEPMSHR